jgi:hypothetical protein
MAHEEARLDALALVVAGVVDLLAGGDAGLILSNGTIASGSPFETRLSWVSEHTARWQWGWAFWLVVTTTFAWSFYALARNLGGRPQWKGLAVAAALLAAAVDVVGIVVNLAVLPHLAGEAASLPVGASISAYSGFESLAHALTDVTAYGLYTLAGLLLLPALFSTPDYPRWLASLGSILWGVSVPATALLAVGAADAKPLFTVSLLLYPPWVWASAWWVRAASGREID